MKTGLLIITGIYVLLAIFIIISHFTKKSSVKKNLSLFDAILQDDPVAVKNLIKNKTVINYFDQKTHFLDPLMVASYMGNPDIVKMLVENGANVNFLRFDKTSALFYAIAGNNPEIVSYLIEKGAEINQTDIKGNTPLLLALRLGQKNLIKYLIEQGADVKASASEEDGVKYYNSATKMDPERYAAEINKFNKLTEHHNNSLRSAGSIIHYIMIKSDSMENFWKPPLWHAIKLDSPDIVQLLLTKDADINWKIKNYPQHDEYIHGMNTLMYASHKGNPEIVRMLIDAGISLNERDQYQRNALYYGIKGRSMETIIMLLQAGIDTIVDKSYNMTFLKMAQQEKFPDKDITVLQKYQKSKPDKPADEESGTQKPDEK